MSVAISFQGDPLVIRQEAAILFGLLPPTAALQVPHTADARDAAQAAVAEAVEPAPADAPKRGRGRPPKEAKAEQVAEQIATEAKVVPQAADAPPTPSAEAQAQDAADEAAESDNADSMFDEPAAEPAKPATLDDVKTAAGAYAAKYGMAHAQADLPGVMSEAVGAPTKKMSELKPEHYGTVVAAFTAATDGNPHQRPVVA